jgi:hypothetical protein
MRSPAMSDVAVGVVGRKAWTTIQTNTITWHATAKMKNRNARRSSARPSFV